MEIRETGIEGLFIIKPKVFEDARGYFFESYNKSKFEKHNLSFNFIQDNQSKSSYGVIRGLHYQLQPYTQTKLIRVLQGSIYDVAVDVRKGSPTFGKWFGIELSEENKLQLLVPKGFAHGFSVLSKTSAVNYKCDTLYNPASERGIIYNDKMIGIDWKIKPDKIIVSERDLALPDISKAEMNFIL